MPEASRSPFERRVHLSPDSPLVGSLRETDAGFDPRTDVLDLPDRPSEPADQPDPRSLSQLIPAQDPGRQIDDWGRSEKAFQLADPILNFYYRYWFRVELEAVENVPSSGGALLVANHSGALPPDGPMIMHGIRTEHSSPRPVYMLGEHVHR